MSIVLASHLNKHIAVFSAAEISIWIFFESECSHTLCIVHDQAGTTQF